MDFWDTVLGNNLARILASELPELNENLKGLNALESISKQLGEINRRLERIEEQLKTNS